MTDDQARPVYAHDAHCNTIHEAGPQPCPPARSESDWQTRLRAMMAARLERKLKARARRDAMRTARAFGLSRRQAIKTVKAAQRERAAMARRTTDVSDAT